jgi:autotransporter-associated beta strand protein
VRNVLPTGFKPTKLSLHRLALWAICSLSLAIPGLATAQLVSFPGALGFGDDATGGRGGTVYTVTNLNSSGAGSFEAGASVADSTIVFAVGGYINLDGEVSIANNVTIEGQTAPGQGIGFMDGEISFSSATNDIVRDIRIRQGNGSGTNSGKGGVEMDGGTNIILDHVSVQFGEFDSLDLTNSTNVTVQNSIISDAIGQQFGIHGQSDTGMTYAYNVFANDHNRNPDVENVGSAQFINNIDYNVQAGYTSGNTGGTREEDVVNNYFITGPSTTSNSDAAFYQVDSSDEMYASGNMEDSNKNGVLDGSAVSPSGDTPESSAWFASTGTMPTFSAAGAFTYDTSFAGDSLSRDSLDSLDISQVNSLGTVGGTTANSDFLYTSPNQSGLANSGYGTITGGTAPTSSANDGIPDTWATTHGVAAWAAAHSTTTTNAAFADVVDPIGYTYIEDYANSLANQFVAQTWTASSGTWNTPASWSSAVPTIFQQALIRGTGTADGAVTLNNTGNSVEMVSIGGNGLATGEQLNVTGGSLTVEDTIFVGDQNNGTLAISGGIVQASNVQLGDTVYDVNGNPTNYTGTLNLNTGGTLELLQLVQGAGTPGSWTSGANWTWSGGILEAGGAMTVSAPATLSASGGIVNTNGFSGTISSVLSGSGGLTKIGTGTLTLSGANQYSGPTTVSAGTLAVTGSLLFNDAAHVFVAADPTGNTVISRKTPAGASYDGYGSSINSDLMSSATILAGRNATNNPNGESINMAWRQRLTTEIANLTSDVITITGMNNIGTTGLGQSDPYALEMNFITTGFTPSLTEQFAASRGTLHLDWLNPNGGGTGVPEWVNAVSGNLLTGQNGDVFTNVQSSWSAFAAANNINDSDIGLFVGSWGVDTTNNQVWAVIDYQGPFSSYFDIANVPEPSCLAAVAVTSAFALRRRRRIA